MTRTRSTSPTIQDDGSGILIKHTLAAAIVVAIGGGSADAMAVLPPGTVLEFDPGVETLLGCQIPEFYTGTSCTFGGTEFPELEITDMGGSYFGMDAGGYPVGIEPREKQAISMFAAIQLGATQQSSGQHTHVVDGSESPAIDHPWEFFSNTGMHTLVSPVVLISDLGSTKTLDFSGWGVNWGEFGPDGTSPTIPLAGVATIACVPSDCSIGSRYELDMDAHVPAAFASVPYSLHLEGTVAVPGPPQPTVQIIIPDGNSQECDITGGNNVDVDTSIFTPEPGDVASVSWFLDDAPVAQGEMADIFIPLGTHTVKVILQTTQSGTAQASRQVTISDSVKPQLTIGFVDADSGAPLAGVSGKTKVRVIAEASDVCDPQPSVDATMGSPAQNNDELVVKILDSKATLKLTSEIPQDAVELRVTGRDSSGNSVDQTRVLTITQ